MREQSTDLHTGRRVEAFRTLILQCRGRTGLTQRELAARIGAHVRSIQDWEAGLSHPTPRRLQSLIEAYLRSGGFVAGEEWGAARALWRAAASESTRVNAPLDESWFAGLIAEHPAPIQPGGGSHQQDWGEAPDASRFVDREAERASLRRWIIDEGARVVQIVGLPGMGKTLLATRIAQEVAPAFERVLWRTVRNAPTPNDWLASATAFLSIDVPKSPEDPAHQLEELLELLRAQRCLLVLDNLETVLEPGAPSGQFRADYSAFGALIHAMADRPHQSCIVITSREQVSALEPLVSESGPVRTLRLGGLATAAGRALLNDRHLIGDELAWTALVHHYSGNALALRVVATSIRELFGGAIESFLAYLADGRAREVASLRGLLDAELERISELELRVLRALAIEREAVSIDALANLLGPGLARGAVFEAVSGLWRRSLLEAAPESSGWSLPSVVLEHITDRLVEEAAQQIVSGGWTWLSSQPLIRATASDYARQAQERVIGLAVVERLIGSYGSRAAVETRLTELLGRLRRRSPVKHGYVPGSLINLLRLVRGDLRGVNMSHLAIRQSYLQEVEAQDANLSGSELTECVLADSFALPLCVALSRDGSLLATSTYGGEVRVWRLPERTPVLAVTAHSGLTIGLALSGDGHLLVSGGLDGALKVWEVSTGRLLASVVADPRGVRCIALSRDGQVAASGGYDGRVKLWDTASGTLLADLAGHAGLVRGVALNADGRLVASCGGDGSLKLWEVATGRERLSLSGHRGGAGAIGLSPSGRLLASGGVDGSVRVWDAASGRAMATLHGHTGAVWAVAVSRDENLVASGSFDHTVKVWELPGGQLTATLPCGQTVFGLGLGDEPLQSGGLLLASASQDGLVRLWDTLRRECVMRLQGAIPLTHALALSADGRVAATGSSDSKIQLWDVPRGRHARALEGHTGGVWSIGLSQDGRTLASGGMDGDVLLWDVESGMRRLVVPADSAGVWSVALSPDAALLASGGGAGAVMLWDVPSGRGLRTFRGHVGPVLSLTLGRAGEPLVSGGVDATIRLWDPETGALLTMLAGHTGGAVRGLALTPDGQRLVSAGAEGIVNLWSVPSGELITTFSGHGSGVWSLSLSRNGSLVASGCGDGSIKLWDLATCQLRTTLAGHKGIVLGVALNADGRVLASAGGDGVIRVWDALAGRELRAMYIERCYERVDITGLGGITDAQRRTLVELGAVTSARLGKLRTIAPDKALVADSFQR